MSPSIAVTDQIIRMVVDFVKKGEQAQFLALDVIPLAIYVTDIDGFITYFNPACTGFAGRKPTLGQDRWCVTWRLYTDGGEFLPHDRCPMAVALQTGHPVRGVTAVAERPDGTRVSFIPFPTPVVNESGEFLGAVNMLVDTTDHHESLSIKQALATFTFADLRTLLDEFELELAEPASLALN